RSLLRPVLWFIDDRTLAIGLKEEDLEPVGAKPREGIDHLQPEIASILKERLGQGTPAWIVGRPEKWETQLELALSALRKEGQPVEILNQVRSFGVWLQFNDGLALNAALQCGDADSAILLEGYLIGYGLRGTQPFSIPPPRTELVPLFRELGRNVKSNRDQAWVLIQAKASGETLKKAVQH